MFFVNPKSRYYCNVALNVLNGVNTPSSHEVHAGRGLQPRTKGFNELNTIEKISRYKIMFFVNPKSRYYCNVALNVLNGVNTPSSHEVHAGRGFQPRTKRFNELNIIEKISRYKIMFFVNPKSRYYCNVALNVLNGVNTPSSHEVHAGRGLQPRTKRFNELNIIEKINCYKIIFFY